VTIQTRRLALLENNFKYQFIFTIDWPPYKRSAASNQVNTAVIRLGTILRMFVACLCIYEVLLIAIAIHRFGL